MCFCASVKKNSYVLLPKNKPYVLLSKRKNLCVSV